MDSITIRVEVGEDHRITIDLPLEVPVGPLDIVIQSPDHSRDVQSGSSVNNPAREAARAKMLAAGRLATDFDIPANLQPASGEELERIGRLMGQGRSTTELIDEDRGEY